MACKCERQNHYRYKRQIYLNRMVSSGLTDALYLSIMYSLLAASAVTWIFFLEATLSRDPVTL